MASNGQDAQAVEALVNAVMPLFRGKPPQVQGAALADLLAMWLAGHLHRSGDPEKTAQVREEALELHLAMVRALIPINYEISVEPQLRPKH